MANKIRTSKGVAKKASSHPSFEVDKYKITCKPRLYLGFFCQYFYNFMLYTFVYHGIILLEK